MPPIPRPSRARADCNSIAIVRLAYTVLCLLPLGFLGLGLVQGVATENELTAAGTQTTAKAMIGRVMIGVVAVLLTSIVVWALQVFAALALRKQQRRTLCMVVAVPVSLSIPLGTLTGIWMPVALNRPDVKAAFGRSVPASAST